MKKLRSFLVIWLGISSLSSFAQTDFGELIPNVVQDIQKFGQAYIAPAANGAMYNINSGWYNSAESKSFPNFEISVTSNTTLVPKEDNNFVLNPSEYNTVRFENGFEPQQVASIFGSKKDISVFIDYETQDGLENIEIELPQGIDSEDRSLLPSVFIQGNLGLTRGTEIKFRYSPEIEYGDIATEIIGVALQHEFTSWLDENNHFPVALAGLVSFSNFNGTYHIHTDDESEPAVVSEMDAWSFSLISSRKFLKFNVFAGLNYSSASTISRFEGVYSLPEQGEQFEDVLNQLRVSNKMDGFSGTLGASYLFEYFKINLSYNVQKYSNISLGFSFVY